MTVFLAIHRVVSWDRSGRSRSHPHANRHQDHGGDGQKSEKGSSHIPQIDARSLTSND
jgi:hypothetical protein